MENLKAIIVFLLFWSIVIWCVIEGKEGEIGIDLNRDEDLPFKRDGDMAMLVWLENGGNRLLPRMKPKDESNKKE